MSDDRAFPDGSPASDDAFDLSSLRPSTPPLDRGLAARCLLGALSEHEQRHLVSHLLALDPDLRQRFAAEVEPLGAPDADLARAYDAALAQGSGDTARSELLAQGQARLGDLDEAIRAFTFQQALGLDEGARSLFTWTMAEHLIDRAQRDDIDDRTARTSLYLARTVIDALEMLAIAGRWPAVPRVLAAVRLRLAIAATRFST